MKYSTIVNAANSKGKGVRWLDTRASELGFSSSVKDMADDDMARFYAAIKAEITRKREKYIKTRRLEKI